MLWPCRPAGSIGPTFESQKPPNLYFYYNNCTTFPTQGKVYHISHTVIYIFILSDPFKTKACSYTKNSC